jgi:hypothetical protein
MRGLALALLFVSVAGCRDWATLYRNAHADLEAPPPAVDLGDDAAAGVDLLMQGPKVVSGSYISASSSGDGFPTYFGLSLNGSVVEDSGQTVSIGYAGIYDVTSDGTYHQSVQIQPGVYQWTGAFSICDPANVAGCGVFSLRLLSDDAATITVTTVPNQDPMSPITRVVDHVSVQGTDWAGFTYHVTTTNSQIEWGAAVNTALQLGLSRP